MRYITLLYTKSLKSGIYFTLRAHFVVAWMHFECSIATCGYHCGRCSLRWAPWQLHMVVSGGETESGHSESYICINLLVLRAALSLTANEIVCCSRRASARWGWVACAQLTENLCPGYCTLPLREHKSVILIPSPPKRRIKHSLRVISDSSQGCLSSSGLT